MKGAQYGYYVVLYSPDKCSLTYQLFEDVFKYNCLSPMYTKVESKFYIKLVVTLLPHTVDIPGKILSTGDEFLVITRFGRSKKFILSITVKPDQFTRFYLNLIWTRILKT